MEIDDGNRQAASKTYFDAKKKQVLARNKVVKSIKA